MRRPDPFSHLMKGRYTHCEATIGTTVIASSEGLEVGRQPDSKCGLRIGAEHEARDRDPDLTRGDISIESRRRFHDRQQPGRERVAVLRKLMQPAATDAHGREFGRNVKGVDEQERRDDEDGRKDHWAPKYLAPFSRPAIKGC